MIDIIIKGGQVVTPWGVGPWDVAVQGEKIVAVAEPGALTGDVGRTIDAKGEDYATGEQNKSRIEPCRNQGDTR